MKELETLRKLVRQELLEYDPIYLNPVQRLQYAMLLRDIRPALKALLERVGRYEKTIRNLNQMAGAQMDYGNNSDVIQHVYIDTKQALEGWEEK